LVLCCPVVGGVALGCGDCGCNQRHDREMAVGSDN